MSSPLARFTIAAAVLLLGAPLPAQITQCVSGAQTGAASYDPVMSADGRFVVFSSTATNLVAGDTNGTVDVFLKDRTTGLIERISVDSAGIQGNNGGGGGSITADGRYVAFGSSSTNLVPGDTNGVSDIFLRDRLSGTTTRVNPAADGGEANGSSGGTSISADGRYIAFWSQATNLVPGDTNGVADVFVRDLQTLTTERVSVATDGTQADHACYDALLSANGRFVVFDSPATNLVAGDTNGHFDVFVRDRQLGTTVRASVSTLGTEANDDCFDPAISADGRFVTFWSPADDLVPNDTNAHHDVFLRDLQSGTTEIVSVGFLWQPYNGDGWLGGAVSDDGRFVVFLCVASNWSNFPPYEDRVNVFLRDRQSSTTIQVSQNWTSTFPHSGDAQRFPCITGDGRFIGFATEAQDLIPGDRNDRSDVYVYDRLGTTNFTSLCDPGVAGVIGCPCGNPPSGPGRGCNNSAGTGGASLTAKGGAYLSSDTLQFMMTDGRTMATRVLLQGTSSPAAGVVYGQGVRCVGGTLKRLYTGPDNYMTYMPDWVASSDPSVSARSAATGSPISPGQSRWYLVFYRDPIVLGGCPTTSTFNATQTGLVSWAP